MIMAGFGGLEGLVTMRSGHPRTFSTDVTAEAWASVLRRRAKLTTYTVMDRTTAETRLARGDEEQDDQ